MPGAHDPVYVAARRVLLDALEAVCDHLDAVVLVGAQAVYLHAGEADLAVAPYTTDGDLAIDPSRLGPSPLIETALAESGFSKKPSAVGIWQRTVDSDGVPREITVDLLVPASLGGEGRRGAQIPPHDRTAARKVVGLEGALVDREPAQISALEEGDPRSFVLNVAGPGALLVAKIHKIMDRRGSDDRLSDKDALDVLRLLRGVPTEEFAVRLIRLTEDEISERIAAEALVELEELFGTPRSPGCAMAVRAASPLEDPDTLTASFVALVGDVLATVT